MPRWAWRSTPRCSIHDNGPPRSTGRPERNDRWADGVETARRQNGQSRCTYPPASSRRVSAVPAMSLLLQVVLIIVPPVIAVAALRAVLQRLLTPNVIANAEKVVPFILGSF